MKTRPLISLFVLVAALITASCKDGGRSAMSSPVSGATNELLVIMNKALWDGPAGDSIKTYFGQPQLGLPQAEPMFDLLNLPPASFEKNVKSHRNVLVVEISNKVDSAGVVFIESPWANSQKYFKISAPNDSVFYKLFNENKERIMSVYLKAERDRLVNVYKKTPDSKIFNLFKDKYHILLYCPGGYQINKDTNDFVWLSAETRVDSKGIIFFQDAYKEEGQLNYQVIIDRVNEMLKSYIPGPLPNTWMALDTQTPVTAATYNYDGEYYAVVIKGLWIAENDYMGGPFVLNVVLDGNRIIYTMGYVYAPDGKKRNMLRQVESVLYTMKINYDKTGNTEAQKASE